MSLLNKGHYFVSHKLKKKVNLKDMFRQGSQQHNSDL